MVSFSFGTSRGAYEKVFQRHSKINADKEIPGPGTYTVGSTFVSQRGKSFSLKGRGKSMQELSINQKKSLPGPGQYSPRDRLNKNGVYRISGMRNTATMAFFPSERFKTARASLPGPGQYDVPESINSKGEYFLSKYKSSGVGMFGRGETKSIFKENSKTPGPGMYEIPGELGYYGKL